MVDERAARAGLRVLHVTAAPDLGGLQRVLRTLALSQLESGLVVAAATSPGGGLGESLRASGLTVLEVPMLRGIRPRSVLRLRRFIRDVGADVVHAHGARATLYSYMATRGLPGPRLLTHVHLADPWRFDGSFRSRLDRYVSSRADAIVACSTNLGAALVERQGFPSVRTTSIPNGIEVDSFAPLHTKERGGAFVVGTCVRLELQKGIAHLLDAVALLGQRISGLQLHIAGTGSLETELRERAGRVGVEKMVKWLGYRRDVPGLLSTFDVFVLPSLAEGLPLAVIEAMAASVPVVATDIPGTNELVHDGGTGLLVPAADPRALADAILRMAEEPEMARRLARTAREFALERHGMASMDASFRRLYLELCRGGRGGSGPS